MFDFMIRNVRSGLRLLPLLFLSVALVGCGGSDDITENENVPDWFLETPEDPNYVYAANSATSQDMQVAIDKATTDARGDLAASLETKIESMTKSFTEEVGDDLRQQYTEAQKEITSQVLRGTTPADRQVYQQDNGTWQAFVLMELPVGEAAQEFLSKVDNNDDEMYTRFRSSQAFKEMKEAVDEYEREQQRGMASQPQGEDSQ